MGGWVLGGWLLCSNSGESSDQMVGAVMRRTLPMIALTLACCTAAVVVVVVKAVVVVVVASSSSSSSSSSSLLLLGRRLRVRNACTLYTTVHHRFSPTNQFYDNYYATYYADYYGCEE